MNEKKKIEYTRNGNSKLHEIENRIDKWCDCVEWQLNIDFSIYEWLQRKFNYSSCQATEDILQKGNGSNRDKIQQDNISSIHQMILSPTSRCKNSWIITNSCNSRQVRKKIQLRKDDVIIKTAPDCTTQEDINLGFNIIAAACLLSLMTLSSSRQQLLTEWAWERTARVFWKKPSRLSLFAMEQSAAQWAFCARDRKSVV